MSDIPATVLPGQPIVPILSKRRNAKYVEGKNCRIDTIRFKGSEVPSIVSSVVGKTVITKTEVDKETGMQCWKVDVFSKHDPAYPEEGQAHFGVKFSAATPQLNDIVLAKVSKITNNRINVEILSVDTPQAGDKQERGLLLSSLVSNENGENFKGIIRSLDVRSTDRDKVKTWECFQPGDIVRAEVISLGDRFSYYLSTARNDLGVVLARSGGDATGNGAGMLMYAVDWETMVVPSTGEVEMRKCANPYS